MSNIEDPDFGNMNFGNPSNGNLYSGIHSSGMNNLYTRVYFYFAKF